MCCRWLKRPEPVDKQALWPLQAAKKSKMANLLLDNPADMAFVFQGNQPAYSNWLHTKAEVIAQADELAARLAGLS